MRLIVLVRLRIAPERMHDFLPLMQSNARLSRETEPGCHHFDVAQDPERPGEVLLYEVYTDRAAFDAHLASAHFKLFDAASADMVQSKVVEFWSEVPQP